MSDRERVPDLRSDVPKGSVPQSPPAKSEYPMLSGEKESGDEAS